MFNCCTCSPTGNKCHRRTSNSISSCSHSHCDSIITLKIFISNCQSVCIDIPFCIQCQICICSIYIIIFIIFIICIRSSSAVSTCVPAASRISSSCQIVFNNCVVCSMDLISSSWHSSPCVAVTIIGNSISLIYIYIYSSA